MKSGILCMSVIFSLAGSLRFLLATNRRFFVMFALADFLLENLLSALSSDSFSFTIMPAILISPPPDHVGLFTLSLIHAGI